MEKADNLNATESAQIAEANIEGAAEIEVNLGKFKDVGALLNAYNSLEAEFTRRSQRIKELEGTVKNAQSAEDITTDGDASSLTESEGNGDKNFSLNIESEVMDFLNNYPKAKAFTKEISEIAVNNKDYSEGFLQRAYFEHLEKRLQYNENLFADEKFLKEKIMENSSLKDAVIRDYLFRVKGGEKLTLISDKGKGVAMPPDRPKTIEQAGLLAKEILIKK